MILAVVDMSRQNRTGMFVTPGRPWAEKCRGVHAGRAELSQIIKEFMNELDEEDV